MTGSRLAAALAAGVLAASLSIPAAAQYYYPGPRAERYYPGDGYGYGPPRRAYRAAMSRVCATDQGTICYGGFQRVGEWCKCGRRETRATGTIVPEQ